MGSGSARSGTWGASRLRRLEGCAATLAFACPAAQADRHTSTGDCMLQTEDPARVRVPRLDRPDRLNAFDNVLYGLLADALSTADGDDSVGVVVITGAGRAFSAGADLTAIQDQDIVALLENE